MHGRQQNAGATAGDQTDQRVTGDGGRGKSRARADQHLTFDAEIDDADTLGERFAQRDQQKRR